MKTKPKSLALSLCGYVTGIFTDIQYLYTRPDDWERDHSRLIHELGIKGERLLTIDFPAIGKHFDKCLDQGQYTPSSLPLTRLCSKVIKVPAFLRNLYLLVFDRDGKLRLTPDLNAIVSIRTLLMGAKKLRLPFSNRSLRDELSSFTSVEQEIRRPSLDWDGDTLCRDIRLCRDISASGSLRSGLGKDLHNAVRDLHYADSLAVRSDQLELAFEELSDSSSDIPRSLADTIQLVADIVSSSFGDLHSEDPSELPKHGPGVVSDRSARESKFDFPFWSSKTDAIFPYDRYAFPNSDLHNDLFVRDRTWLSHEPPSKIIAVPKTAKGPRLIAAEPSSHQWLQQLVLNQLVKRLEATPIKRSVRFNDQSRNRRFALEGSRHGLYATIDLSSASDRMSCWLVERLLRKNIPLLERLHACRTRSVRWSGSDSIDSFWIRLNKFAPMGSACTFPVQSVLYCIIAVGVHLWLRDKRPSRLSIEKASSQISVFGDDIIVPKRDCVWVIRALEYSGLKVNTDKTFYTGKFRESCGIDAWGGHDVTYPRILDLPDNVRDHDLSSFIEVSNNFFKRGFWRTSQFLLDRIPKSLLKRLPVTNRDDLGNIVFSFVGSDLSHLYRRYNKNLQREEVSCMTTTSSRTRGPCSPSSRLFQWFIEKPHPETHWISGVAGRKDASTRPGWHPVDKFMSLPKGTTHTTREP